MRELFKLEFRVFGRRWPLAFIGVAWVVGAVYTASSELHRVLVRCGPLAETLSSFTPYAIAWPLIAMFLTFESTSSSRTSQMDEAVASNRDTMHWHLIAAVVPTAALTLTVYVVYLLLRIATIIASGQTRLLFVQIVLDATLNFLVPTTIAMLMGLLAGRRFGRYAGYAAIAAFGIVIGPYIEIIPAMAQPNGLPGSFGLDLYPLYDLFRILPPDSSWSVDALYGFPLEPERWFLAGAWLAGLSALSASVLTPARSKWALRLPALLSCVAVLFLAAVALPSTELRRDARLVGGTSVISDQGYYLTRPDDRPQRVVSADFHVSDYIMDLRVGNLLTAKVDMKIAQDTTSGPYRFTLYHDYRLKQVRGAGGVPLEFTQDGDYVTVKTDEHQDRIVFDYAGSGGISIANQQCIYLPGYFPYYPVPGHHRIWDAYRLAPLLAPEGRRPSNYSVNVRSGLPLASDLEYVDGRYRGRTTAPSFVGGFISESMQAGHRVVSLPLNDGDPAELGAAISNLRALEARLGVERSVITTGTTVFEMPSFTQGSAAAVALPGSLFVMGIEPNEPSNLVIAGTPRRIDRENLRSAFVSLIDDSEGFKDRAASLDHPQESLLLQLEAARRSAPDENECVQTYVYPAGSVVHRLLYEKVLAEGLDPALRDTYRYLASDNSASELEFLSADIKGAPE